MAAAPASQDPTRAGQSGMRRRACLSARTDIHPRMLVLAVESNLRTVNDLRAGLADRGVEVVSCADPAEALLLLGRLCPDAVVLGEVLGRISPLTFLRIARMQEPELPIVVAANSLASEFAAQAADNGATAVLSRPPGPDELLRAVRLEERQAEPLDLGRLRIDGAAPRIWVDGDEVALPPREFAVLRVLAQRVDAVVSREELLDAVWGQHDRDADNSLSVHILRLRRRLGDTNRGGRWITAVRGVGYRLWVPSQKVGRSSSVHHV